MATRTVSRARRRTARRARSRPFVGRRLGLLVGGIGLYIAWRLAPDHFVPILIIVLIVAVGGLIGDHLSAGAMRLVPPLVLAGVVAVVAMVAQGAL